MNRILSFLAFLVGTLFIFSSCKDEPMCYEPKDVQAVIAYKVKRTVADSIIIRDSVAIDSTFVFYNDTSLPYLNIINFEDSSLKIMSTPYLSTIKFHLNPNQSNTNYLIRFDTVGNYIDTLKIFHHSFPVFISNDCGFTNYFMIDSIQYLSDVIDSISIRDREVNLQLTNNRRIAEFYFFK